MATGIPSRRAPRMDENAPPKHTSHGIPTRSRTSIPAKSTLATTIPTKPTLTTAKPSALPVMKRQNSSALNSTANGGARAAFGEVSNATKVKKDVGAGVEKVQKPPTTTATVPRRTRSSAVEVKKEVAPLPSKRKATSAAPPPSRPSLHPRQRSTTHTITETKPLATSTRQIKNLPPSTHAQPIPAISKALIPEPIAEPARKRRKTSTPPPEAEEDDLDEGHYDEDGKEILLSSGSKAVSLKSPKRPTRAKDEGWTDLDGEDEGDPTMVSEYVVDAFNYMLGIEAQTMPDPKYMSQQTELQWKMRTILMDWIIEVHTKFRLLPETLFIATNLIDRFLSARVCSLTKFQLVGMTALFVAAKYEEVICPSVSHFLHMSDGGYGIEEILKAERYMLSTVGFDMSYPNPLNFLRRISKADNYDIQTRTVGKYLVEIGCVEHRLLGFKSSLVAAAGMWLARLCLGRGKWDANLVHYSTYSEEELLPAAQIMLDHILDVDYSNETSFFKKYAGKKHMKASVFVRNWAIERWPDSAMGEGEELGVELYHEAGLPIPEARTERGSGSGSGSEGGSARSGSGSGSGSEDEEF